MFDRRGRCRVIAVAVATTLPLMASASAAQDLTIVAPAAPGGGWDQTARAMQRAAATLAPALNAHVENVPGAAGTIGLARFATAERGRADALLVTGLVMVSGIVATRSPVSLADVTPIARLTGEEEVIVVPASSPYRRLGDLLDAFKRQPRAVSWGGGSAGGTDDLLARLIGEAVGVAAADVNYVAFSGGGEALAALLGGQVTAGVSGIGEFAGAVQAGQLRALAVAAPARVKELDAPTLRESGVPLELSNWRGVVAPPGLSAADTAALTARVRAMNDSAAWRQTLARNGWSDLYLDGLEFRRFLLAEQARVEAVLHRLDAGRTTTARARWTPTPRTAPIVAVVLAALFAGLQWRGRAAASLPALTRAQLLRAGAIVAACGVHATLAPVVGFVPTAALLFAAGAYALGSSRWRLDLAVGVAVAASVAGLFAAGLGVPLPSGVWLP